MSGPDGSSAQHASAHHGAGSPRDRTGAAPERPWIGDCDKACDLIRRTAPAGALRSWPRVCRLSSGRGHQGSSVYATRGPGAERGRAGANRFIPVRRICVSKLNCHVATVDHDSRSRPHDAVRARRARASSMGNSLRTEGRNGAGRGRARGTTGAKSGRLSV